MEEFILNFVFNDDGRRREVYCKPSSGDHSKISRMIQRTSRRLFSSFGSCSSVPVAFNKDDIAHKQVDPGYTKKFAEGWERIFGKKPKKADTK